jgi:hypothetical protein
LKPYTNGIGVGVGFQVRTDGEVGRSRERGRKTRILKSVTFTLDTDPPTRAPPLGNPNVFLKNMFSKNNKTTKQH